MKWHQQHLLLGCVSVLWCLTLCGPMDWGLPGSSAHGIFQARILEYSCHFLLQGIFLTWGLNPSLLCLPHQQADSLSPAPPGKPLTLGWLSSVETRLFSYSRHRGFFIHQACNKSGILGTIFFSTELVKQPKH